jgi:hypothetical protein
VPRPATKQPQPETPETPSASSAKKPIDLSGRKAQIDRLTNRPLDELKQLEQQLKNMGDEENAAVVRAAIKQRDEEILASSRQNLQDRIAAAETQIQPSTPKQLEQMSTFTKAELERRINHWEKQSVDAAGNAINKREADVILNDCRQALRIKLERLEQLSHESEGTLRAGVNRFTAEKDHERAWEYREALRIRQNREGSSGLAPDFTSNDRPPAYDFGEPAPAGPPAPPAPPPAVRPQGGLDGTTDHSGLKRPPVGPTTPDEPTDPNLSRPSDIRQMQPRPPAEEPIPSDAWDGHNAGPAPPGTGHLPDDALFDPNACAKNVVKLARPDLDPAKVDAAMNPFRSGDDGAIPRSNVGGALQAVDGLNAQPLYQATGQINNTPSDVQALLNNNPGTKVFAPVAKPSPDGIAPPRQNHAVMIERITDGQNGQKLVHFVDPEAPGVLRVATPEELGWGLGGSFVIPPP